MLAFKWFSLFLPPTSLKVLAPYNNPNNFILLGPIYTCSWLVNHLLKRRGRRWWNTCSIFKTPKALKLTINNALKVVTELNLFVLICYKHNLHFSEGDLSILMFQEQLSPMTNNKQLQACRAQQAAACCDNCYLQEKNSNLRDAVKFSIAHLQCG